MNKIFFHFLTIVILLTGNVNAETNLSPRSAATAQTFGNFSGGLDAVYWNPANLGFYGKPIYLVTTPNEKYNFIELEKDTLSASVDSSHKYYSVQLIASQNKKHVKETKNTFHDQFGQDIPSAIIEMNSLYKLQAGDFIKKYNAEILRDSLIGKGYKDAWIVSHNHPLERTKPILIEKSFSLELLNMGVMLSNSSADASWINTYILNGIDLGKLDDAEKNEIISTFPDDGWRINPIVKYKSGFRINNFAIQVTPDVYSEFVIPRGLFELAFDGNEMSKPIDFSGRKNQFQAVTPVSISYGRQINIPLLNNFAQRTYFGVSAKYLAGLAYFESAFDTLSITPNPDYHSIQADIKTKYSLAGAYMEVDTDKSFNYSFNTESISAWPPPGSGYAFDLGLIMSINDKLSSSIAVTNLLGKITWSDDTAYKHRLKMNSQIPIDELQKNPDSSFYSGIKIDTNITISSFQTNYPGALILGIEYSLKKVKLASNLKFGFSNELGSSTIPRFSLGAELHPLKWLSLLGGTSVGGYEGFQWGSGISMKLLFLQFSCTYSEYGGILDSAKGFSVSTATAFFF